MTRGGPRKAKRFTWRYDPATRAIIIVNERERALVYTLEQVVAALHALKAEFGSREIPLANNVAKVGDGSEQPGFGTVLIRLKPGDTSFAQGASYLGVVLEDLGYLRWNGRHRGIAWHLTDTSVDRVDLERRLLAQQGGAAPNR